jgi:hypothetical protein
MNRYIIISWIIGIIGWIIAIILFKKNREKKKLTLFTTERFSTISVTKDIKPDIGIYFKDAKVDQIDRIEIIIVNKGNIEIDGSEIITPIKFSLPQSSKILKYEILAQSKKHIEARTELLNEREINFLFTLLKPKDKVRILLLCSDMGQNQVEYSGRIKGLPSFDKEQIKEAISSYYAVKNNFNNFIISFLIMILFAILIPFKISSIVQDPSVFPYKNRNSFRIFNIISQTHEIKKGRIMFVPMIDAEIKREKMNEIFSIIPTHIAILDPTLKKYIKTKEQESQIDSLFSGSFLNLPVGRIERIVSGLDSNRIVNEFGNPENITITYKDTIGYFSVGIETWKYKSKNILSIIRKYALKGEIIFLCILSTVSLIMLFISIYLIKKLINTYSILTNDEKKQLISEIKYILKF